MKKVLTYCFFCLIILVFSCSDDDGKPARVNLIVNGEPVEVNEVVMWRSVWSNSMFGAERLEIFGRVSKDKNLNISIEEYGEINGGGILQGGGIRPRIYSIYDQYQEDGEDCVYNGAYCDHFYFYLSPYGGLYPSVENVIGHLEIIVFDLERRKVAGTFSITGNEIDSGSAFSITGEFNSSFTNSPQ